jgi:hypothetical protein
VLEPGTRRVGVCQIPKEGEIVRTHGLGSWLPGVSSIVVICLSFLTICFNLFGTSLVFADLDLLKNKSADPWANLLPVSSRNSLLDPSKLDISHQLVFSYYSGSAGKGDSGGLFLTRFRYPLSSPLLLDLTIGSSLNHSAVRGFQSNELFIQNFSLRYAPNDNFLLMFMYNGAPYNRFYFPAH